MGHPHYLGRGSIISSFRERVGEGQKLYPLSGNEDEIYKKVILMVC